jgi:signal transduction histidine kinase
VSSRTDPAQSQDAAALTRVTALIPVEDRALAGRSLARHLGAEDLIIFVTDPEIAALLPALGFPQTLPDGRRWRAFLASCTTAGPHESELTPPGSTSPIRITGMAAPDGSVLALLGGQPRLDVMRDTLALVPLLAATFRCERKLMLAEARARSAHQAVREATMLATALDDARRQLQDALISVERALRVRDEFLSIASHELKTPLTGLLLQVQLFQRFSRRLTNRDAAIERISAMADTMERQVKRLSQLTYDLLDTSRITSGRLDLRIEKVDLVDLAQEVIGRFGDEAAVRGSAVHLQADASVAGKWDRSRLDQVLTNVLSNAIKYGRGEPIQVTVTSDGARARLSVRDHGIGIDAADRERIFGRFERVRMSSDPGGLGLGLYITRQIVDMHGGKIQVDDAPGGGSTFTVELPFDPNDVT